MLVSMRYIACMNQGGKIIGQKFSNDAAELESFARRYDRPANNIYDCVAELRLIARRYERRPPYVDSLSLIHVDVDPRSLAVEPGEVEARLDTLPAPFQIRDSGHGRHVLLHLTRPVMAGPDLDYLAGLRTQMTTSLSGDRHCDHSVCLLRRPNTTNYKYDPPRLCHILRPGAPIDLSEAEPLIRSLGDPWFTRGAIDPRLNPARVQAAARRGRPVRRSQRDEVRGRRPRDTPDPAARHQGADV